VQLETVAFLNRTPDFAYALLFCAAVLVASTLALPTAFLTSSLIAVLLYLWSRENPAARVSFFGLFTVDGFYLPWVMVGWTLVSGGSPAEELRGIVAAHLYWFLSHEWPRAGGPQNLMATPEFVRQMVAWAFGGHHMTQASFQRQQAGARGAAPPPPQPQRAGGGAFQGRGRRLNE
jgi:Derlin-2/3